MRNYFKLMATALLVSVALFSCKKDDPVDENQKLAEEQNALEERIIPTSEITSGVNIQGATLVDDATVPSPSGTVDFQISTNEQEAFLNTGFEIPFSSTSDISGAYIVFKDSEGNAQTGYYNVPASSFNYKKKSLKEKRNSKFKQASLKKASGELSIEVDFDETIKPGTFCFDICLYDYNGNISPLYSVCVTVEAWGGNSNIVGNWIFDRVVPEELDDMDEEETFNCESGGSFTALWGEYTKDTWEFVLNADGTYYEQYDQEGKEIDYSSSISQCTAVYENVVYSDKYSGNWAYNETKKTLTVIDFKYEDLIEDYVENYNEGSFYFEGADVKVENGELVITDSFINDYGQVESYTVYFKRK